nr:MAG TPA: hypothetical protein [Caudoviricetes sp.]
MGKWQITSLTLKRRHCREITKAHLSQRRVNELYRLSRDAHGILPRRRYVMCGNALTIMKQNLSHHHRRTCRNEKPRYLMNRRIEEVDTLLTRVLIGNIVPCRLDCVNCFARFHDNTSDKKWHLHPRITPLTAWNNRIHRCCHRLCHRVHIAVIEDHPRELDDRVDVGVRQRDCIAVLHGKETAVVVEQNTDLRVDTPRKEAERLGRYMIVRDGMQSVVIGETINPLDGREVIRKLYCAVHEIADLIDLLTFEQIALHIGEVRTEIAQNFVHGMVNLIVREFHLVHVLLFPAHHFFQMFCVNHSLHLPARVYASGLDARKTQGTVQRTSSRDE